MGWTTPRTWTDGELVGKAIMDPHIRDNLNYLYHVAIMKASDETVNNSTTLQNDNDFLFTVAANDKWAVEMTLYLSTGATPDWKANWTKPASTTITHTLAYNTSGTFQDWRTTDLVVASSGSTLEQVHVYALVLVAGTAGTVQFQWAQNTLDVSNTIVKAGSYMIATRCQ